MAKALSTSNLKALDRVRMLPVLACIDIKLVRPTGPKEKQQASCNKAIVPKDAKESFDLCFAYLLLPCWTWW